jgi:flagellin-like protein
MKLERRRRSNSRGIKALTPVIATVLMIAVTLVVAFAAWAWATGATTGSEKSFNNSTGQNINQLKERIAIVNANFSATQKNKVTVWFYNDGSINTTIIQVWVSNSTYTWCGISSSQSNPPPQCSAISLLPVNLPQGGLVSATFTASSTSQFTSGSLYTIKVVAQYGNTFTYMQVR